MQQRIFFVGTESEVGYHAAPLSSQLNYEIVEPDHVDIAHAGDLAIFYSEHFDRFRNGIQQLKKNGVATLYLIDGVLEWRNAWETRDDEPACPFTMRPVLAHKAACIGLAQAQVLATWGNASKTEVVGVPRFDALRSLKKRVASNPKRILLMTAKCPSYDANQHQAIVRGLQDLKCKLDARPDIEVVWRLTGSLPQEIGVENQLNDLSGAELAGVLQTVDAVITSPSTALLEAMLLDLPVAMLDYTNSPNYTRSVWNITGKAHINNTINDLLNPPESKLVFQRQLLAESLYLEAGATDRFCELVSRMLTVARQCIEQGRELEFEPQLLSLPSMPTAVTVGFHHAAIFPHAAFNQNDAAVLQSELAHARREIEHLNRQIAQLRSELGEAHQIFQQIHRHPIAGPVVRSRQKLIELIDRLKKLPRKTKPTGPAGP